MCPLTRKIVSEMTYNVSSGTLNPTIPYHTQILKRPWLMLTDQRAGKKVYNRNADEQANR